MRSIRTDSRRAIVNVTGVVSNAARVRALLVVALLGCGAVGFVLVGCSSSQSDAITVTVTAEEQAPEDDGEDRLSAQEYQRRLDRSAGKLRSAIRRLTRATTFEQLSNRASSLQARADGIADALASIRPPETADSAHETLIEALHALAIGFGRTGEAVISRSLCAPPAVTARLSNLQARARLDEALRGLESVGFRMPPFLPKPRPLKERRLNTGHFLIEGNRTGLGRWKIENGRVVDAVVAITNATDAKPLIAAYIRANEALEITGIPDGNYHLYFTLGKDWDGKRFTQKCEFTVADDPYPFTTSTTQYSVWTTTLHPVKGGTASVSDVDPDSFPTIPG